MLKKLLLFSGLLLIPIAGYSQGNVVITHGTGAPSGNCAFVRQYLDDSTGDFYTCPLGVWTLTGHGGGGISGTGVSGQATYWTGAAAIAGSANWLWNNASQLQTVVVPATGTGFVIRRTADAQPRAALGDPFLCFGDGTACDTIMLRSAANVFQITSGGALSFAGAVSGSASIGAASAAGTPNKIVLPTATGTNGYFLKTDGGNPQQLSWAVAGCTGTDGSLFFAASGGCSQDNDNLFWDTSHKLLVGTNDATFGKGTYLQPTGLVIRTGTGGSEGTIRLDHGNGVDTVVNDWQISNNDEGNDVFEYTLAEETNGTYKFYVKQGTTGSMYLNPSGGNVGIGTSTASTPTAKLQVTGAIATTVNSYTSTAGSAAIDLALSNVQQHTLTENTTCSLSNIVAGQSVTFIIVQHAAAAKTFTCTSTQHVIGFMTVSATLSSINIQTCTASGSGSDLYCTPGTIGLTGGTP